MSNNINHELSKSEHGMSASPHYFSSLTLFPLLFFGKINQRPLNPILDESMI